MRLTKSRLPLYYQLEKILRKQILSGQIKVGEPIPTEKELCEKYDVSRTTVRQALSKLEDGDLICREQGRGTFVSPQIQSAAQYKLSGYMEDLFNFGKSTELKILHRKRITPPFQIAHQMSLDTDEKVYLFEGFRVFEKSKKAFFQAYVPQSIGEKIDIKSISQPLFINLVEKTAIESVRTALQESSAQCASKEMAKKMDLNEGSPLLVVKRIYFTDEERVLEIAITYFPGTLFTSVARLTRVSAFNPQRQ